MRPVSNTAPQNEGALAEPSQCLSRPYQGCVTQGSPCQAHAVIMLRSKPDLANGQASKCEAHTHTALGLGAGSSAPKLQDQLAVKGGPALTWRRPASVIVSFSMPEFPTSELLQVAVLPAPRLQDVFEAASQKQEALLRQRLLQLPVESTACLSKGLDRVTPSDVQGLLDSQLQPASGNDTNELLQHCSKQGLLDLQQHFQPAIIEMPGFLNPREAGYSMDVVLGSDSAALSCELHQTQRQHLPLPIQASPACLPPLQVGHSSLLCHVQMWLQPASHQPATKACRLMPTSRPR